MDPDSIERVIVVREGPITPSMDEALAVVTRFVPLLPDDAPLIRICPGARGMMNEKFTRDRLALSLVQGLEHDGVLAPGAWARSRPLFIRAGTTDDTDYLVTVVRKPDSTPHNQPLVHVHVLLESLNRIDPDYMTTFLQVVAPEVFENSPTIRGVPVHPWRDDPQGLALAMVDGYNNEYLSDRYDIEVFDGRDQDGTHWALVKIFQKQKAPKHVDPDYLPDSSPDSQKASEEAQTARLFQDRIGADESSTSRRPSTIPTASGCPACAVVPELNTRVVPQPSTSPPVEFGNHSAGRTREGTCDHRHSRCDLETTEGSSLPVRGGGERLDRPHSAQKLFDESVVFRVAALISVVQEQLGQRLPRGHGRRSGRVRRGYVRGGVGHG
ncbi:MAG: hypothetical protein ACRDRS_25125 [Pseudonocardiaceae bacterium]